MRKYFALVMFGILGFAAPVSAQTVSEIAINWGIVGVWQKDCDAPISQSNDQQAFVIRDGKLFLDRSTGERHDSNPIVEASIDASGALDLQVAFTTYRQIRQNVYARMPDGRQHVVVNRNINNGAYSVRNGILLSNKRPTPLLTRCG